MNTAFAVFKVQEKGILNIIRAADIYTIHLIAKIRSTEPNKELIAKILEGQKISGYNLMSILYSKDDLIQLQTGGYLREIGQQIVVATYTALESYLVSKFEEYYSHFTSCLDRRITDQTMKRIRFRSLADIKDHFNDILDIHLPSFEIDYSLDPKCSFQPTNSWEAIKIVSNARNEISHRGFSSNFAISTLMDSWYPFDFTRMWIMLFDANFDYLIYEKFETRLIKEYRKRKEKLLG
jgi:hypothetical protein